MVRKAETRKAIRRGREVGEAGEMDCGYVWCYVIFLF